MNHEHKSYLMEITETYKHMKNWLWGWETQLSKFYFHVSRQESFSLPIVI